MGQESAWEQPDIRTRAQCPRVSRRGEMVPMTAVFVAIAVIVGVALVIVGRQGGLPDAVVDLRPEQDPLDPTFDVVLRGYRMDEVDAKIFELQAEILRLQQHDSAIE